MKRYRDIQLLTGGGARFGYYLGSYAALCEGRGMPDAVLGSCGGSIAAWLIMQVPDPKGLYALATSSVLHRVLVESVRVNPPSSRFGAVFQAAWRYGTTRGATRMRRVHAEDSRAGLLDELSQYAAFVSFPQPESWLQPVADWAQSLGRSSLGAAPDVWVFASRLLAGETSVCFQPILFAPKHCSGFRLPENPVAGFAPHRQTREIGVVHTDVWQAAVAASIADMYYQPPVYIDGIGDCMGGVIDLVPLECALALADTVWAERKPRYDVCLAEPAILRVFGTPANLRHAQIHARMNGDARVRILPFEDNRAALRGKYIGKSFDWFSGCLKIDAVDAATFAEYMDAQWQYGYQRTMAYLNENNQLKF